MRYNLNRLEYHNKMMNERMANKNIPKYSDIVIVIKIGRRIYD